jgi:hypothetical protein
MDLVQRLSHEWIVCILGKHAEYIIPTVLFSLESELEAETIYHKHEFH